MRLADVGEDVDGKSPSAVSRDAQRSASRRRPRDLDGVPSGGRV